jgi:alkylation response protein AidB-like acyl-CoA dehydrogenase
MGFGGHTARLLAAEALLREASEKTSAALANPNLITPEQRGELAVLLSATKVVAVEVGIQVTANLFELTGARSTARVFELDRFFRDLRTQSLHDPVAQKRLEGRGLLSARRIPPRCRLVLVSVSEPGFSASLPPRGRRPLD